MRRRLRASSLGRRGRARGLQRRRPGARGSAGDDRGDPQGGRAGPDRGGRGRRDDDLRDAGGARNVLPRFWRGGHDRRARRRLEIRRGDGRGGGVAGRVRDGHGDLLAVGPRRLSDVLRPAGRGGHTVLRRGQARRERRLRRGSGRVRRGQFGRAVPAAAPKSSVTASRRGLSASPPRRYRDPPPRNMPWRRRDAPPRTIHVSAAAAPRDPPRRNMPAGT